MKVAPREFIEHPLADKEIGVRFAADMDKWLIEALAWEDGFEAGQFLHRLSIMSTRVTKRIAKGLQKSLRSSYKNGWSPCFFAYKANLAAMLEVRRHVLGQHGHKIWITHLDASTGIIRIVNHWEGFVKALGCSPAETTEILEEFHAPSYWRTAPSSHPQFLSTVEAEIVALRAAMHERNRNDMR